MCKAEREVFSKLSSIQVFFNKCGDVKYARAMHYVGRLSGEPQFVYHQLSLGYIRRKLNEMPKDVYSQIMGQLGQIGNVDLDKPQLGTVLVKSWASSSVRKEHQP
jgi:hypothetical protein